MTQRLPQLLLILLLVLSVWSYTAPQDIQVWWTEMGSVILLVAVLVCSYRSFRFSNTAYVCMAIWCALQIIGAHYTFEHVPFDTITGFFGFERNHYDRVAHFAVGLAGIAIAELLVKLKLVNSVSTAAWFSMVFMLAIAGAWEIVEWIYAEIDGGEAGQAFLGSQGDTWDAQKDMLMDTLGAATAAFIFCFQHRSR